MRYRPAMVVPRSGSRANGRPGASGVPSKGQNAASSPIRRPQPGQIRTRAILDHRVSSGAAQTTLESEGLVIRVGGSTPAVDRTRMHPPPPPPPPPLSVAIIGEVPPTALPPAPLPPGWPSGLPAIPPIVGAVAPRPSAPAFPSAV